MMNLTGLGVWTTISVVTRKKLLRSWSNTSEKKKWKVECCPCPSRRRFGVQLNNEINITDRLENPGLRELAAIMNLSVAAGDGIFGLNADVGKAHTRVKVKEDDCGVLACKTSASSDIIWLNKTGPFGVASAAYWWSRLMGLVGRFAFNVMFRGRHSYGFRWWQQMADSLALHRVVGDGRAPVFIPHSGVASRWTLRDSEWTTPVLRLVCQNEELPGL